MNARETPAGYLIEIPPVLTQYDEAEGGAGGGQCGQDQPGVESSGREQGPNTDTVPSHGPHSSGSGVRNLNLLSADGN